jgi:hypothetical protein
MKDNSKRNWQGKSEHIRVLGRDPDSLTGLTFIVFYRVDKLAHGYCLLFFLHTFKSLSNNWF